MRKSDLKDIFSLPSQGVCCMITTFDWWGLQFLTLKSKHLCLTFQRGWSGWGRWGKKPVRSKIRNSWVCQNSQTGLANRDNLPASGWEEHPPDPGNHLWSGKREEGCGRWRERERKGGWGSPSAVLILEVSVVECVGMGKTKYSSGGKSGREKDKMLRWTGQSTRSKRHFHMFICHGWTDCDKHFHLIGRPIQK